MSKHWRAWAAAASVLVMSTAAEAQNLDSLTSIITQVSDSVCGKEVVLLGELPSHGEARAFQIKAGIVERCGFDAVFFEAPVYDFLGFQHALIGVPPIRSSWTTRSGASGSRASLRSSEIFCSSGPNAVWCSRVSTIR